jgi:hypothetical protein
VRRLRIMDAAERQQAYQCDAHILGGRGTIFARASLPKVEVRLPKPLAQRGIFATQGGLSL